MILAIAAWLNSFAFAMCISGSLRSLRSSSDASLRPSLYASLNGLTLLGSESDSCSNFRIHKRDRTGSLKLNLFEATQLRGFKHLRYRFDPLNVDFADFFSGVFLVKRAHHGLQFVRQIPNLCDLVGG